MSRCWVNESDVASAILLVVTRASKIMLNLSEDMLVTTFCKNMALLTNSCLYVGNVENISQINVRHIRIEMRLIRFDPIYTEPNRISLTFFLTDNITKIVPLNKSLKVCVI